MIYLPSIYAYGLYFVFIVSLNVCLLYASSLLYCHVKLYIAGVYFSAHWCPPCRAFTPHLAKKYETWKNAGHPFEIIFVSSDRDQSSFDDYYKEMPWLTVPYDDEERRVIIYFVFIFFPFLNSFGNFAVSVTRLDCDMAFVRASSIAL